ncbi:uncharacterized protein LOC118412643 [Branchiostoma floridae]|uniref:Uncharacterized protein LOC118412643 n=1 Tax=Branchiostoma floridae TaxID=7739 RepID=A0A9J7KWN1_BRAFL|nr:uncharacterized protein LOC118412643 [Branchiostoma floridae]
MLTLLISGLHQPGKDTTTSSPQWFKHSYGTPPHPQPRRIMPLCGHGMVLTMVEIGLFATVTGLVMTLIAYTRSLSPSAESIDQMIMFNLKIFGPLTLSIGCVLLLPGFCICAFTDYQEVAGLRYDRSSSRSHSGFEASSPEEEPDTRPGGTFIAEYREASGTFRSGMVRSASSPASSTRETTPNGSHDNLIRHAHQRDRGQFYLIYNHHPPPPYASVTAHARDSHVTCDVTSEGRTPSTSRVTSRELPPSYEDVMKAQVRRVEDV